MTQDTHTHKVPLAGRITLYPGCRDSLEWLFPECLLEISLSKFPSVSNSASIREPTMLLFLRYESLMVQVNASTMIYEVNEVPKMFVFRNRLYSIETPELNYLQRKMRYLCKGLWCHLCLMLLGHGNRGLVADLEFHEHIWWSWYFSGYFVYFSVNLSTNGTPTL